MNNPTSQNPFCQAAIFTCNSCTYQTHIYSNLEWLKTTENKDCEKCKGTHKKHFDEGIIYRHDLGDSNQDIPLHMQFARPPLDKQNCEHCINQTKMHWTELLVHCHQCNKDTMQFTEYTVGKNIDLFYEWCLDWAKPSHPKMDWINKNGDRIFVISGTGGNFLSS